MHVYCVGSAIIMNESIKLPVHSYVAQIWWRRYLAIIIINFAGVECT